MANTATLQLNADSRQVKKAANDLDEMADAAAKAEIEAKQLDSAVKKLSASELRLSANTRKLEQVTGRLAKETNDAKRAELQLKAATLEASGAQQAASISAQKLAINQAKLGSGAEGAGKKLGLMKSRVQQVGFQVQDFIVQLQGGTSGFVAFGQQGSQLAGAFGPGGAIIGAFIALGSVVGGLLATQMANAGNAVDDLIDKLRDGTEEVEKLGEAQKKVFRREQLILISDTAEKVASYDEKIVSAEATLRRFQNATAGMGVSQFLLDREIAKSTETLDDLNAGREAEVKTLAAQKQLLKDVAAGISNEAREAEAKNKDRQKGLTERSFERVVSTITQKGETPLQAAQREFDLRTVAIQNFNDLSAANDASAKAANLANEKAFQEEKTAITKNEIVQRHKLETAGRRQAASIAAGQIGQLASIAKEGGKEQFDNYKKLAQTQAIISTAQASANALATPGVPFPVAAALAVTAGLLGAVQVAAINQQQYQPRANGGQMKAGGSFLVGERGPELVTMGNRNANIKSAGSFGGDEAVQVTNVFQISTGVTETVRAEILRAAPSIAKMSVAEYNRASRAGGTTSRITGAR